MTQVIIIANLGYYFI